MSPIEWDQSFSVGHKIADGQHREFLAILNTMERVFLNDSGIYNHYYQLSILKRLLKYIEKHFSFENKLMQVAGYQDAYNHWRSHKNFDISIYTLYRKVLAGELILHSSIFKMVHDKFFNHILKDDKPMFERFFQKTRGTRIIEFFDIIT